ncbi:MAG TPA: FAD:protein FMN transferase [Candidatus Dormibacteraeota bacterium]|nr:FAD:protein FMN transferase [Candidatus Dormibacteraeota bacterium]
MAALAPPPPFPAPSAATPVRRLRTALGTYLALEAVCATARQALPAIPAACAAITEVEALMHPARPGSDVQRINEAPPGTEISVHPLTFRVLAFARHLHELSEGVFDPCLPQAPARLSDLLLRRERPGALGPGVATFRVACARRVALDLGGIAKGFAVDQAIEALQRCGCGAGLVNAGGDLRVFGPQREPIFLRQPSGHHRLLWLADAALAVSDPHARGQPAEHRGYYRRSARSARWRYAAVLAADAMSADALTKCVMLCAPRMTRRLLAACGADVLAP